MSAQGSKENTHQEQIPQVEEKIFTDEELNTLIDPILQSDDLNKDGFIDYPGNFFHEFFTSQIICLFPNILEFIRAQQKSAAANQNKR